MRRGGVMTKRSAHPLSRAAGAAAAGLALACGPSSSEALRPPPSGAGSAVAELMAARGLSDTDVSAALKTYVPNGKHDDFYMFSSGGQSGQVIVIGIPSMR